MWPARSRENREITKGKHGIHDLLGLFWDVLGDEVASEKESLLLALIFTAIAGGIILLGPYFIQKIIDNALPQRDLSLFFHYMVFLCVSYVFAYLFLSFQVYFSVKAAVRVLSRLKAKLIESIIYKPVSFFSHFLSGDLSTRFINDLESISNFFYHELIRALVDLLFSLILIAVLLIWKFQLGIVAVLTLPILFIYIKTTHHSISQSHRKSRERLSEQNEVLLDLLSGNKEIRFFQQEKQALERFQKTARSYAEATQKAHTLTGWYRGGIDFLSIFVSLLPFLIGSFVICQGSPDVTIGLLVAYLTYLMYLTVKIQYVSHGLTMLAQISPALHRIKDILDFPHEQRVKKMDIRETPDSMKIEFKNVSFIYPTGEEIFRHLNLSIQPGEKVAIMGPSGSGKSTLGYLLLRFLIPDQGTIMFGYRDIQEYSLPFYLSFFAYVSQQTHLFRQTIKKNISRFTHCKMMLLWF